MIRRILLATDGSKPAGRAADFAASLAIRYRAEITIVHAYIPLLEYRGEPDYRNRLHGSLDSAEELVESLAQRLLEMGVDGVETEIFAGPAVDVILGLAESGGYDLIVIGARGMSTWHGILLGSVSMAVTHRAQTPLLVVK